MNIQNDIVVFDNAFPLTFCTDLIEQYKTLHPQKQTRIASNLSDLDALDMACILSEKFVFVSLLRGHVARYLEAYKVHELFLSDNCYIARYKTGEGHPLHHDFTLAKTGVTDLVAVVLFLNADFEGGGLHFPRQNLTVQEIPGRLVLFPTSYTHPHEVRTVTSGDRYVVLARLSTSGIAL